MSIIIMILLIQIILIIQSNCVFENNLSINVILIIALHIN